MTIRRTGPLLSVIACGGTSPALADCCSNVLDCAATVETEGLSCEVETRAARQARQWSWAVAAINPAIALKAIKPIQRPVQQPALAQPAPASMTSP
jgi:hypothetical protein